MRKILQAAFRLCALAFLLALLAPSQAHAVPVVALLDGNRLAFFDSASPGTVTASGPVTGLLPGDRLLAIDFRPATGQLYAFGTADRVYIIDPQTRAVVGTAGNGPIDPAINANAIAFDFDPARDRIRILNDDLGRQNFLVDPDPSTGGGVTVQTPPTFAPGDPNAVITPVLHGLAYDNNFLGLPNARAWAIHRPPGSGTPVLVTVAPGGGLARTVATITGSAALTFVTDGIGFDIAPVSGVAYASLKTASPTITVTGFYSINLSTGVATHLGDVGEPGIVVDIAVVPPPVTLYAVTDNHELISFNSATPSNIRSRVPLTGLVAGQQIYEIDFSPQDGRLYGLGRGPASAPSNDLYRIDPQTGVATRIFGQTDFQLPLLVGDAGFEVSPTTGRIRIVTQGDQNLDVPQDGLGFVISHPPLAYAAGDANAGRNPDVLSAAYANNVARAAATALYDIDLSCCSGQARLARQGQGPSTLNNRTENTGQLFTVATGVGVGVPVEYVGFDIVHGVSGAAFLSTISINDGASRLSAFNINDPFFANGDGEIGFVGPAGAFERVRDLAAAPSGFFSVEERVEVLEDCAAATIRVRRAGDLSNEATVDYETVQGGRATERADYGATRGTLLFAAGQTEATFKVLINEDAIVESGIDHMVPFNGESFNVRLTNPTAGFQIADPIIHGQGFGSVHILDDGDTDATPNPIDASQNFVCQQYHDFLSREPDQPGLDFWTQNIESCGASQGCREVKRIDTSAAFFLSIEFQDTGYLVHKTYAAAFGLTRVGQRVPLTLQEFLPDTQRVGRGLIVGQGDWQSLLAENKRTYFEEFVEREAFRAAYPRSMTAAQYVEALNANAGGPLTAAERAALAAAVESGDETRATALRRVAESPVLHAQQKSPAFVLMQYFGYLRRNPNDPPEPGLNFGGYDFWLGKLNQFGGDHRAAEMVKAFITSAEYRRRFDAP